jgi:hypothetical protein
VPKNKLGSPYDKRSSDPLDQIALVLRAIKDPRETAHLVFDPHRYAAKNGIRLYRGFEGLRGEVVAPKREFARRRRQVWHHAPPHRRSSNTNRAQFHRIHPGEVAALATAAIYTVAEIVAYAVQI